MSTKVPQRAVPPAAQTTLDKVRWLYRLHGIMEPLVAMQAADMLLADTASLPEKDRPAALHLATGLLRQALVLSPLDKRLARLVSQLSRTVPMPAGYAGWYSRLAPLQALLPELPDGRDFEFDEALNANPDRLLGLALTAGHPAERLHGLVELWKMGDKARFLKGLEAFSSQPVFPLAAPMLAWGAWACADDTAVRHCLDMALNNHLSLNLEAELALARGESDTARERWLASLEFEPAQPSLLYRLHDLAEPGPAPGIVDRHRVHVAFYTFNKLEVTLDTLASLLASDIGPARVTLLNNGSTTFSPEDLERGVERVRQGREVRLIHLPVNIGAPAARNWLKALPETSQCEYLAYLDDDVLLPRDWLARFLHDIQADERRVVVGPQGVNPSPMATVQYIYRFFDEIGPHKIRFSHNAPTVRDFGQYAVARPCLSVMGCCHLFDLERVARLGVPDFDIRFTPSQVDDLEHDLQVWKAGGSVFYDGRVRVVHRQDSGRKATLSRKNWSHVWGNHMKMEAKFDGSKLFEMHAAVMREDAQHWREIHLKTAGMLSPNGRALHAG